MSQSFCDAMYQRPQASLSVDFSILEWVATSFSSGSSWPGTEPCLLHWPVNSLPLSHQGSHKIFNLSWKEKTLFRSHQDLIFHLSELGSPWTPNTYTLILFHSHWGSVFISQYFLFFRVDNFYSFIFKFIDHFFSHLQPAAENKLFISDPVL